MKLRDLQIGYIAGIIDGEGSILLEQRKVKQKDGTIKKHFYPSIRVAMKSRQTIDTLQNMLGGIGKVYYQKDNMALLFLYQEEVREVLSQINEFLITKKPQGQLVLEFMENGKQNGEIYHRVLKDLRKLSYTL